MLQQQTPNTRLKFQVIKLILQQQQLLLKLPQTAQLPLKTGAGPSEGLCMQSSNFSF